MENIYNKKYLKFKDIFAYSMGLFGLQCILFYLNSYQAEFYASTMGANFAIVGILLLISRIVSAIADPVVGNLIERKQKKKYGKFKPFIFASVIPIALLTTLMFVELPIRGTALYIYIFILYTLWGIFIAMADVPTQGMAAVLTPNPKERSKVIEISNTFKAIGQGAPFVIVPVVCLCVPKGAGFEGTINSKEYLISAIVIAILGCGLISLIGFVNKEKVPYSSHKMKFKDVIYVLKNNKPLMLVMVSYFLGFARQLAMGIQVQTANAILGSANKLLIIAMPTGIGAMISMLVTPFLIKKFNEKRTFIGLSVYGFIISVITFFVGYNNLYLMLFFLFLLGLQFGALNIIPSIMVADSVDYYEVKTEERVEGIAFATLTFSFKVTLAMGVALGLGLMTAFKYTPDINLITESTKKGVYFAFTVVPGITSLLSAIPICFYKLVGKEKEDVSKTLKERREKQIENQKEIEIQTNDSND